MANRTAAPPLLRLEAVTKRFGPLTANDHISLDIHQGEVHVLFGENGAGKSTLANLIYGCLQPTSGAIYLNGQPARFRSPRDAAAHSIGMVHQHFMLVPTLSGIKNLLLGLDYGRGPLLDLRQAWERAQTLCEQYHVDIDLNKEIWKLSVGEQQWVEILKALFLDSKILILDEPTAVLTMQQAELLMERILDMKRAGITVIMVSHKLKEIDRAADRISVLRRGKLIGTVYARETSHEQLVEMMLGSNHQLGVENPPKTPGKPVLELDRVSACNSERLQTLTDVTFQVRGGEIFGIAGVSGNGQTDLYEAVTALRPLAAGQIKIHGQPISETIHYRDWSALKVAEIPEDRIQNGSIGSMTLEENLIFGRHWDKRFRRWGILNRRAAAPLAARQLEDYDVRPAELGCRAQALSGGNLQKLLLSRELSGQPRLIVAAQPTRGLDIIAEEFIWKQLLAARAQGAACLLISEDLDELAALSDRIGVLYKGRLVRIFDGDFSLSQIGSWMIHGGEAQ
ncbi:ABC transporter ATP-binding protein [Pseudoflavonifractor sp. 524-17]|uniref:ABC transporter ATP-binding protein n=1 Tax=Pseudoflavonifractor sp. 524-17 TaxID=2304577 RepID=UPI0013799694|nr:ABC transporter ATP-binding protein [Pseudoflavonifractor sp. 524-17]NCE63988.1 ABC transporter ATP-binding protein [Pseudoflavonifractor sp. 524-17]